LLFCVQVKENKKKRIHAIKSQWRLKKKDDEQTAKQVRILSCSVLSFCCTQAFEMLAHRSFSSQSSWKSFDKSIGKKKVAQPLPP
jgi:hypothetical protein